VLVYLPDDTVPVDARTRLDLVSFAVAGGVIGSLVGWLWQPRRVALAVVAGAIGGFLGQMAIVVTGWQSTAPVVNGLKFAVVTAAMVGAALLAMSFADRPDANAT
jgi:CHASE2 domain-containing sensor protein